MSRHVQDASAAVALPEASSRDREVQHVVLQLVAAYAFRDSRTGRSGRRMKIWGWPAEAAE